MAENTLDVSNGHIDSLIKYVLDTKPYHTKLSEVVEEFLLEDSFAVTIVSDTIESMAVLGLDYMKRSSNPLLNIWQKAPIRPESSLSAERALVSDGSRRLFAVAPARNNKFFTESSQEVHVVTADPTSIPGFDSGLISPRRFSDVGVPHVALNGVKLTEGVDYNLSLGAFSFEVNTGTWVQHNIKDVVGVIPTNGDITYTEVIRPYGRITGITANFSVPDYQEWALTWNSVDQMLDVVGSISGHIGQAEYGVVFTHTLISLLFTHAPGELAELPVIANGDTFVLTPSAKITVHPDAATEVWTLIKTNPQVVVADPIFTGVPGPAPLLTVFASGSEFTPTTTFTITFTGDTTFNISSSTPLTGYPKTGLLIDEAFIDAFVHVKIIRADRVFAAGNTFTFGISNNKSHYLVHGSITGWAAPATIDEWYWNGKIGFKIPRLEYFVYMNDDVNSGFSQFFLTHHAPLSSASPSKYEIVFHAPNSPTTTEVTASVFNNLTGYGSGLRCGQVWSDAHCSWTLDGTFLPGDKITVLLAPSTRYSYFSAYAGSPYDTTLYDVGTSEVTYAANILQEHFPLYHSFGSVIIPSAQPDDIVIVNKTERDHIRLRIGKPSEFQDPNLVLSPTLGDVGGWVPLSFKYFSASGAPCVFPDFAEKIEAYLAVSPDTKVFEIRQPLNQLAVIEFTQTFFEDYLPTATEFWLRFHQNSSYAQTTNVKVSEHLGIKLTVLPLGGGGGSGGGSPTTEWIVYLLSTDTDQLYSSVLGGAITGSGMGAAWQIYLRKISVVRDGSGELVSYTHIDDGIPPPGVWTGGVEEPMLSTPTDLSLPGIWSYTPPYTSATGIMQIASESGITLTINFADFFSYGNSTYEYSWTGV